MRSGTAQSFLESVNTPKLLLRLEGDHDDNAAETGSCSCCCRCGRPERWKPAGPRGKRRSKSYTALRTGISELSGWDTGIAQESAAAPAKKVNGPGEAALEKLPVEILGEPPTTIWTTLSQTDIYFRRDRRTARARHRCSVNRIHTAKRGSCIMPSHFANDARRHNKHTLLPYHHTPFFELLEIHAPSFRVPWPGYSGQKT